MTDDDLRRCGIAARRQLGFLWDHPPTPVVRLAIDAVVWTASTDSSATDLLLRRALEQERLRTHGANDLHWLCDAIPKLAALLPSFVQDLYIAVMEHDEDSNEATQLLGSAILPLTSTRRQDVDMAKWNAVRHYPAFLDAAPERSLAALAHLVGNQADAGAARVVTIDGRSATIVADGSDGWDEQSRANEHDVLSLLNAFEEHVAGLQDEAAAAALFTTLATASLPAALWRRVIGAGARNEYVARHLMPLDAAAQTLAEADLLEPLAQLIVARVADRPADERERLEGVISSMEPGPDDGSRDWYHADYRYRRLLHAIAPASLVTDTAAAAQSASSPPAPRRTLAIASFEPFADSADRYGIEFEGSADREAWPLIERLQEFVDEHLNEVPDDNAVDNSLNALHQLRAAPEYQHLSGQVRDFAESTVARTAEIWTRRERDVDPSALSLAKSLLLGLQAHRLPMSRADEEHQLFFIPSGPRTDVARGLLQLARFEDYLDDDVIEAIRTLANDDVPWIRFSVARGLPNLRRTRPDIMWMLLREIVVRDSHDGVLRGVALAAWVLQADIDDAVDLLVRLAERVMPSEHRESALESCTEIAGVLYVRTGHASALQVLNRLSNFRVYGSQALRAMLHEIRQAGAFTSDDDAVRRRALTICIELVDDALSELNLLDERQELDAGQQRQIKAAAEILDSVTSQLYFASGAFEARRTNNDHGPSPAESRLADEAAELVTRLGTVPIPRVTHHLVEFLGRVLDTQPERTLLAVRDVIMIGGQRGGYQLDKMAVQVTVRIVERLLADHRGILQSPRCLTALRQILDVFVDAGWPEAHRLAYGLEHIFR